MPAIVQFPNVLKEAFEQFGHLFANEPERAHFAEYLTGLLVAYRRNVSAILVEKQRLAYKSPPIFPLKTQFFKKSISKNNAKMIDRVFHDIIGHYNPATVSDLPVVDVTKPDE